MSLDEEKKPLFSSHIFMFPFRFDWNDEGFENEFDFYKENTIDERVDFQKVKECLKKDWTCEPFKLKKDIDDGKVYMYNEFAYFYDYARDSIYNLSDKNPISYYFEKKIEEGKYHIDILKNDSYILDIEGLSLRIFDSGVGILSIELLNRQTSKFEDILKINDYGRRIYPQYIKMLPYFKFDYTQNNKRPYNIKEQYFKYSTSITKTSFLANKIKILANDTKIEEKFEFKPGNDIVIGSHVMDLLGGVFSQDKKAVSKYYIQPILDDRMFVISWLGNEKLSNQLVDEKYIENDDWYKYVFVDGKDKTVFSPKMQAELIQNATYDRWMNYKYGLTLYGISRYSFVALTNEGDFGKNKIRADMESMYFQMITILLATRASILRFSDEISALASDGDLKIDELTRLYKRYLTFYNRLYFKELTHQDQGIELYDKALKQMKISEHIEKLDGKFTKLFEFAELQATKRKEDNEKKEENERNKSLDNLAFLGATFLPPSLLASLYGLLGNGSIFITIQFIILMILTIASAIYVYKSKSLSFVQKIIVSLVSGTVLWLSFEGIFT